MRKIIPILSILYLTLLTGVEPISADYDLNSNILTIQFDENIRTDNVLLGLMTFEDSNTTMALPGGLILNPGLNSDEVIIDLVYEEQIDERVNTTDDNTDTFQYWGKTNGSAVDFEEMDLNNLILNIEAGAFIGEDYSVSAMNSINVVFSNTDNSSPVVTSAEYDAGENLLEVSFDRLVKFDQIAEDRTPGNGILDGNPSEDTNGNGVLDTEQNINPFNITIFNGDASTTLEGLDRVEQTDDSNVISIYLTVRDAKKIELDVIGEDNSGLSITVGKGAFIDTNYNPNESQTSPLSLIPESMPLVLTNATYEPANNEFRLYFDNSRDVEIYNPFPVYSKITISDGQNSLPLNGLRNNLISAIGKTMMFNELLYSDQELIEQMMLEANNENLSIHLDTYSVYDVNGNGNLSDSFALTIIGDYDEPEITDISYDSGMDRFIFNWDPDKISYLGLDLINLNSQSLDVENISITNTQSGEILNITSADVNRDNSKENTYLTISHEDAEWMEIAGENGDNLVISIAPYTFFSSGNTNNNGNFAITDEPLVYLSDDTGPVLEIIRIDFETNELIAIFNENIETSSVTLNSIDLIINGLTVTINDLSLLTVNIASPELRFQISDSEFLKITDAIPLNQFLDLNVLLPSDAFNNIDNMTALPCLDMNGNFQCDDYAEEFDDFGSDGIPSDQEEGYPGFCSESGGCSDPTLLTQSECEAALCSDSQFDNEDDCLEDGACQPRFFGNTRDACESHDPPGTWNSDNSWDVAGVWTIYSTETLCIGGSATWTAVPDPEGDDFDLVNNPEGTEGNGNYEFGEPFSDEYPNGEWDLFEPITFDLYYGQELWNESHRAFAAPPALMHLLTKYTSEQFNILVEESIWNGFCIETDSGVNPYDIYEDANSPEACDALPKNSDHDPVWVQVFEEDIQSIADFFNVNKGQMEEKYGDLQDVNGDGKITLVIYDIVDEYIRGSNDTNSSLYTHGYFTAYPAQDTNPGDEVTVNVGELLFLDAFPQVITADDPDDELFASMYNAIIHEYTKLLITQNESEEEVWIKEGLAYFEQKRILDDVKFFGGGTTPITPAANQLSFISFSKKNRTDHYNVYLFFNYLFEKYSGATGWEIIDELITTEYQGIESINLALDALGFTTVEMQDVFINYATACFMDLDHQSGVYEGIYRMDNVNLYGAPAGKNAASLTFNDAKPPPYSKTGITPWSFDYYLVGGFSVNLVDNSLIIQSPLLNADDDLVFDGYDGIDFKVNKIMLKNGFTVDMDPLYEVVEFEINPDDSKGMLPVSTNSISGEDFTFRGPQGVCSDNVSLTDEDCCTNNSGSWDGKACADALESWTWSGNMNMILVVAKVDDEQPPPSYDYVVTNITSPQDFSDFYVLQNVGVQNFLDLYVVSQRPIFDVFGVEGPQIQIASQYDTTIVVLEPMETPGTDQVIYYSPWVLGLWDHYTLTYEGMDQSGNPVEMDEVEIFTEYSTGSLGRSIVSNGDQAGITIYDTDNDNFGFIQISNNRLLKNPNFNFEFEGLTPISDVFFFGPDSYTPNKAVKLWFNIDPKIEQDIKVYHLTEIGWINMGGSISNWKIQVYSETMGYYLLVSGDNHLASQELTTIPELFSLNQNYPNPFNPSTKLDFSLPEDEFVTIQIYNLTGQLIRTITQDFYTAGDYSLQWNGITSNGQAAPSGMYFTRIQTKSFNKTIKMVLMK